MVMITFVGCRDIARGVPFGSTVDEVFRWIKQYELDKFSIVEKNETSYTLNLSHVNLMQTAARVVAILTLPSITKIGIVYNIGAGVTRLLMGFISHIKDHSKEDIDKEFEDAFIHLLTAVYDYAIGHFSEIHKVTAIIAPGLGLFPIQSSNGHSYFFNKEENFQFGDCAIKRIARILVANLVPEKRISIWSWFFRK